MLLILAAISGWSFKEEQDPAKLAEQFLLQTFDAANSATLKKWELTVTDNGFFRIRKYYPNGKREYFSFNLKRLAVMDYLGTEVNGTLVLRTQSNAIIVQTFNDPKGNVDSTSSVLNVPLKSVNVEQLNMLQSNFSALK